MPFVLGTALAAVLMRQTRNSMIEVMSADYIRTHSKGLAGRAVVFRHAIRNSLIPVVTVRHPWWPRVIVVLSVATAIGAPWIAAPTPCRPS
jgi:ABC-type dipeptide/oligopeptide/nickel transport system permease component